MKTARFDKKGVRGQVRVPSSKSMAHRALILAALAGDSCVMGVDICDDVTATINALSRLGAQIDLDATERKIKVGRPCARNFDAGELDVGQSASTLRFLIPVIASLGVSATFVGQGRLGKRPTDMYKELLTQHGARLEYHNRSEYLPLRVSGKLSSGQFSLRGDVSSQFVTGLLLALSQTEGQSTVKLTTKLESRPYVDMSVDMLRRFGAGICEIADGYCIVGGQLKPANITLEGDCSQAAFFAVAAAIGGEVKIGGIDRDTKQGDIKVFDILKDFGANVRWNDDGVSVCQGDNLIANDIDASDIPDLVPALAVLAALSSGTTRIYNAARLRLKESDRIASIASMLECIGADVRATDDGLVIIGKPKLRGGNVCTFGDHRIAMAAAIASLRCDGDVLVDDISCVSKSYPAFMADFENITI